MRYRTPSGTLAVAAVSGWDAAIDFLVSQSQYYMRGMVCGLHATMFVPFLILFAAAALHIALRFDERGLAGFFWGMPMAPHVRSF